MRYKLLFVLFATLTTCRAALGSCELLSVGPTSENPGYAVVKLSPCDEDSIASLKAFLVRPGEELTDAVSIPSVFGWCFDNTGLVHLRGWPKMGPGKMDLVLLEGARGKEKRHVLPAAFNFMETGTDVVMLVDDSHSMRKTDPHKLRITAANLFAEISAAREDVATISAIAFSNHARVLLKPTPPSEKNLLTEALEGLEARGSTDMDKAFVLALRLLGDSGSGRKIGLVLSDGRDAPGYYGNAHRLFEARGWPVYTVGLSEECDAQTLKRIADETGGKSYFAPTAGELSETFREVALSLHHSETIAEWPFTAGDETTIPVDDTIRLLSVTLSPGPENTHAEVTSPPGNKYILGKNRDETFLEIDNPATGKWSIKGSGKGVGRLEASAASSLVLLPFPLSEEVHAHKPVPITCLLLEKDRAVTGANIRAVFAGQQSNTSLDLFDDGRHMDGGAGDGIYGGMLVPGPGPDQYRCRIVARGTTGKGLAFQRVASLGIKVQVPETAGLWVRPRIINLSGFPGEKKEAAIWVAGRGTMSIAVKPTEPASAITIEAGSSEMKFPEKGVLDFPMNVAFAPGTKPGPYSSTMDIKTDSASSRVSLRFDVKKPTVSVQPSRLDFGDIMVGTGETKEITIHSHPRGQVVYTLIGNSDLLRLSGEAETVLNAGSRHTIPVRIDIPGDAEADHIAEKITVDWGWGKQDIEIVGRILLPEPEPAPPLEPEPDVTPATNLLEDIAETEAVEPMPTGVTEVAHERTAPSVPEVVTAGTAREEQVAWWKNLDPAWIRLAVILALLLVILLFFLFWLLKQTDAKRTMLQYLLVSTAAHVLLFLLTMDLLIETEIIDLEKMSPSLAVKVQTLREKYTFASTPRGREIKVEDNERPAEVAREQEREAQEKRELSERQPEDTPVSDDQLQASIHDSTPEMSDLSLEEMEKNSEEPLPLAEEEIVEEKKDEPVAPEDKEADAEVAKIEQQRDVAPEERGESRPEESMPNSNRIEPLPAEEPSTDEIRAEESATKSVAESEETIKESSTVPQHRAEKTDTLSSVESRTTAERAEMPVSEEKTDRSETTMAERPRQSVPVSREIEHANKLAETQNHVERESLSLDEVIEDRPLVPAKAVARKEMTARLADTSAVRRNTLKPDRGKKTDPGSNLASIDMKVSSSMPGELVNNAVTQVQTLKMKDVDPSGILPETEPEIVTSMPRAKTGSKPTAGDTDTITRLEEHGARPSESSEDSILKVTTTLPEAQAPDNSSIAAKADVLSPTTEASAIRSNNERNVAQKSVAAQEDQSQDREAIPVKTSTGNKQQEVALSVGVSIARAERSTKEKTRTAISRDNSQDIQEGIVVEAVIEKQTPSMKPTEHVTAVTRKTAEASEEDTTEREAVPIKHVNRGEVMGTGPRTVRVSSKKEVVETGVGRQPILSSPGSQQPQRRSAIPVAKTSRTVPEAQTIRSDSKRKAIGVPQESETGETEVQEVASIKNVARPETDAGPGRIGEPVRSQTESSSAEPRGRPTGIDSRENSRARNATLGAKSSMQPPVIAKMRSTAPDDKRAGKSMDEPVVIAEAVATTSKRVGSGESAPLDVEPTVQDVSRAKIAMGEESSLKKDSGTSFALPESDAEDISNSAVAVIGTQDSAGDVRRIVPNREKSVSRAEMPEDEAPLLGASGIDTKKQAEGFRSSEKEVSVSVKGATGERPEPREERRVSSLPEQHVAQSELSAKVPELMTPVQSEMAVGGLSFSIGKSSVRRRGSVPVCLVRYSGGDWNCSPTAMMYLSHQISERTGTALEASDRVVDLADRELMNAPFVYMTGHKDFRFTEQEIANLRKYLQNGGRLWADDSTHFGDERFDKAFRREIARVLPDNPLEKIPQTAELFKTGYDLTKGFKGYSVPPGDKYRLNYLEGVDIKGSTAVVYTRNDYGDGLDIDPNTHPLMPSLTDLSPADMQEGSVRMGVNIVMYFLSAGTEDAGEFIDNTAAALRESETSDVGPDLSKMAADLIDKFDDQETWSVEDWSDSGSLDKADEGMKVDFTIGTGKKFAFTRQFETPIDLSSKDTVVVEIDNMLPCGARVALAVFCGEEYEYYESKPCFVKPGKNSAVFALSDGHFKSEQTNWLYSTKLGEGAVQDKLTFLIYSPLPGKMSFRKLRIVRGR